MEEVSTDFTKIGSSTALCILTYRITEVHRICIRMIKNRFSEFYFFKDTIQT